MPARDGFLAPPEMIADFTEVSRQLFIEAFNRDFKSGLQLHPAFESKPLSMVTLNVATLYSPESETNLESEHLSIEPLREDHVSLLGFLDYPLEDSLVSTRQHQAEAVGAITLTSGIDIGDILRPGHVTADYQATDIQGEIRQVDTFTERPAIAITENALRYAKNSLEYLKSGADDKNELTIMAQGINRRSRYLDRTLATDTYLYFDLRIIPELPLNRHESTVFLRKYYIAMHTEVERQQKWLKYYQSHDEPGNSQLAENTKATLSSFTEAKIRAWQILEERGET